MEGLITKQIAPKAVELELAEEPRRRQHGARGFREIIPCPGQLGMPGDPKERERVEEKVAKEAREEAKARVWRPWNSRPLEP